MTTAPRELIGRAPAGLTTESIASNPAFWRDQTSEVQAVADYFQPGVEGSMTRVRVDGR